MNEAQLTQLYKSGDSDAMEIIFDLYYSKVMSTVTRILSFAVSEDVTQDVFMEIFKSHKNFKGNSSLSTWIYRITINRSLLVRNRLKKALHVSLDALDIPVKGHTDLETGLIKKDEIIRLNKYIAKLKGRQKQVLVLRTYENLSYKQIAEVMEITENNAKTTHFKAVEKLRQLFYKRGA